MMKGFTNPVRVVVLVAALAFAPAAVESRATGAPTQPVATARSTGREKDESVAADRDGVPAGGVLIIAGIVVGIIVLAWICSRISDNRPSMS